MSEVSEYKCPVCFGNSGRIFGAWADCPKGWQGRLAEIEDEADILREKIWDDKILNGWENDGNINESLCRNFNTEIR